MAPVGDRKVNDRSGAWRRNTHPTMPPTAEWFKS